MGSGNLVSNSRNAAAIFDVPTAATGREREFDPSCSGHSTSIWRSNQWSANWMSAALSIPVVDAAVLLGEPMTAS
jgi:hypothetical protein